MIRFLKNIYNHLASCNYPNGSHKFSCKIKFHASHMGSISSNMALEEKKWNVVAKSICDS
jgi:hypothetical protein